MWRFPALVVLGVVAVFGTTSKALAADFNDPNNRFHAEQVAEGIFPGVQSLATASPYSEARLTGGDFSGLILRTWRGLNDNQVWFSFGNDFPAAKYLNFNLGTTATYNAPTVVALNSNSFMAFHVGTNFNIYYTIIIVNANQTVNWSGKWTAIPGQTTNTPVSAANYSNACGCVYLVYTGSGGDPRVYGTWYSGGTWTFGGNIGGGQVYGWPTVTYNPATNELWVVGRGRNTGTSIWFTFQTVGAPNWPAWTDTHANTAMSPSIAANNDGSFIITGTTTTFVPFYALYDRDGDRQEQENDSGGGLTFNSVNLVSDGNDIYVLLIGTDNVGYWRQLY